MANGVPYKGLLNEAVPKNWREGYSCTEKLERGVQMAKKNKEIKHRSTYGIPDIADFSIELSNRTRNIERLIRRKSRELKRAGVDNENGRRYLQSLVDEYWEMQMDELIRIYRSSCGRVNRIFLRRYSDKKELENILRQIEDEISELESDYEITKKLYEAFNPPPRNPNEFEKDKTGERDNNEKQGDTGE